MTKATSETTLEQSLLHVSDLLRCAAATAYETGDSLNGPKRDLAFSAVHPDSNGQNGVGSVVGQCRSALNKARCIRWSEACPRIDITVDIFFA